MIKSISAWNRFEDGLMKENPQVSFLDSLRLMEAMWNEGRKLGVLPPSNPLDGIEVDIEIARVLNCLTSSSPE
jgi:hypothetical protein